MKYFRHIVSTIHIEKVFYSFRHYHHMKAHQKYIQIFAYSVIHINIPVSTYDIALHTQQHLYTLRTVINSVYLIPHFYNIFKPCPVGKVPYAMVRYRDFGKSLLPCRHDIIHYISSTVAVNRMGMVICIQLYQTSHLICSKL